MITLIKSCMYFNNFGTCSYGLKFCTDLNLRRNASMAVFDSDFIMLLSVIFKSLLACAEPP